MKYETVEHCYLCGHAKAEPIGQLDDFRMMRCKTCSFTYIDHRPVEMETDELYNSYFSGSNADYGKCYQGYIQENQHKRSSKLHLNRFHKRVLKRLKKYAPGNQLLDIGCAAGFFMQDARDSGWEPRGIDIAKPALDFARSELSLDVAYGRLLEQQYPDAAFDAVTMFDLIEHLYAPLKELREIHRILKPGGILCIYTPNVESIKRKIQGGRWYAFKPREHNYYFSRRTLQMMLEKRDFEVLYSRTGYTRWLILPHFRNRLRRRPWLLKLVNGSLKLVNETVGRVIFKPFELFNMGDAILLFARKKA